jgi:hypothetical protein
MQIREMIKLLEKTGDGTKIDRSAFLYLESNIEIKQFAQCKTCLHFMPQSKRCGIFGPEDVVIANASCGLYVQGVPNEDQQPSGVVTPEAAGYVVGQVRCENCSWANDDRCGLYETLMDKLPDVFDLDPSIQAKACCNAWQSGD